MPSLKGIRHILQGLLDLSKTLRGTLSQMQRSLAQVPNAVCSPTVAFFEDAHGSTFQIDSIGLVDTWTIFNAVLREKFATSPGLARVRNGTFRLHDGFGAYEIDQIRCDFKVAFRPGRRIRMSILFEYFEVNTEKCPICGSENTEEVDSGNSCVECQFWYKSVQDGDAPTENDIETPASHERQSLAGRIPDLHRFGLAKAKKDLPGEFARISITAAPESAFDHTNTHTSSVQSLESFDPVLFGDYRDSRDDTDDGGDSTFDFFDEARNPAPLEFADPRNPFGIFRSPQQIAPTLPVPITRTANLPIRSRNLMAEMDKIRDGDEEHANHRPTNTQPNSLPGRDRLVSCNDIW